MCKPVHWKWLSEFEIEQGRKMDEKWKMHQKRTRQPFLKNGVFQIIFHVISLLVIDSIFQKNEQRNEIKNESKMVTVNNANAPSVPP
jgi:hypothetical protein